MCFVPSVGNRDLQRLQKACLDGWEFDASTGKRWLSVG
jgi:hypothetical protein